MRARLLGVALVGVGLLTGCYAQTQSATDVGSETATLRGHGTADKGPAHSWFEYNVTGRAGDPLKTSQLDWPAGASGPIIQKVSDLSADAPYSFRVCGWDNQTETVCAQTKTFRTKPATEDAAHGSWFFGCCNAFDVDARSGPDGENPSGTLGRSMGNSFDPVSRHFGGTVTCLEVDGRRAIIGAVGQLTTNPPGTSEPATMLAMVEDGVAGADHFDFTDPASGSTPPDCTGAFSASLPADPWFEFVVNDAP